MERIQQFGSIAQRTRYLKTLECLEVRKIQVQRCIEGIDESTARRKLESDAARTARLRVYMTKQGLRETRFRLTGEQKKDAAEASGSPTYALFKFLYDRCKSSGFEGCAIPIGHMAAILGKSTRSVQRNLDTLDAAGLIVRIQRSGKSGAYAISLPESDPYLESLEEALGFSTERNRVHETEPQHPA